MGIRVKSILENILFMVQLGQIFPVFSLLVYPLKNVGDISLKILGGWEKYSSGEYDVTRNLIGSSSRICLIICKVFHHDGGKQGGSYSCIHDLEQQNLPTHGDTSHDCVHSPVLFPNDCDLVCYN